MHIENNPEDWFNYINGNQLLDYTMARFTTKDEDGNSIHSSDEEPVKPEDSQDDSKDSKRSKASHKSNKEANKTKLEDVSMGSKGGESSSIASVSSKDLDSSREDGDESAKRKSSIKKPLAK